LGGFGFNWKYSAKDERHRGAWKSLPNHSSLECVIEHSKEAYYLPLRRTQ